MNKTTKVIIGLIVLGILVWIIKGVNHSGVSTNPIKIGAVESLTGAGAAWGEMSKKGIDLAVKEINAAGGINGQNLEIVYEDSNTNPAKDVSAFTKLVSVDVVSTVVGDVWSFTTNPMVPIAEQTKTVLISPTVMDVSVDKPSQYFYTMGHIIDSQRKAIETFFDLNKDIKTLSIICWNDSWGNANKNLVLDIAKARSIKIVSNECINDFSATYQAELTKIKGVNPDAIYFNSSLPDVVLRKIKDLGMTNKKVLSASVTVDAIEVNKTPVNYLKNVFFTQWVAGDEFNAKFQKEYGISPIIEAQNSYDTVNAIAVALKMGGDFRTSLNKVKFVGVEGKDIDFTKGDQIRMNEGEAGLYTYDGTYHKIY